MKLVLGILLDIIGHFLAYLQLQGQFKFNNVPLWVYTALGIPIGYIYVSATGLLVQHFEGQRWPVRLISFAIGAMVFAIMTKILFNESISYKTGTCLGLACCIVVIQVFWK